MRHSPLATAICLICLLFTAYGWADPESPWSYRYQNEVVSLEMDPTRAVVVLEPGLADELAGSSRRHR